MSDKKIQQNERIFCFQSHKNFQTFQPYRLVKNDENMLKVINNPQQKSRKVQALIKGCIRRHNKNLYKGQKYYIEDLQFILQKYPTSAPPLMKQLNIVLNKSQTKVNVQCHNCANFKDVWKFCPTCEDVHYCHQGCEMKIKFTHQRQQCKIRPFPKIYKPLQVQIYVGSDLGKNIHFCFQHQVSMSLLVRGQKLLGHLKYFFSTPEGSAVLDDNHITQENKMIKLQKQTLRPQIKEIKESASSLTFQTLDDVVNLYTNNKTLRGLEIFLLQNGAILWKKVRQIHDNHFREVFIFHYP